MGLTDYEDGPPLCGKTVSLIEAVNLAAIISAAQDVESLTKIYQDAFLEFIWT